MPWSFLILVAASGAAGMALGRILGRRTRRLILIGGAEAALLGGALSRLPAWGVELPLDPVLGSVMALGLLAIAAVLISFAIGAAWTGP